MSLQPPEALPKWIFGVINNLFEIEKKLENTSDDLNLKRNVERIRDILSSELIPNDKGVFYENPIGERFLETRTDLDATITGEGTENLYVTEVIKPVIRLGDKNFSRVVQKGIVLVQSKDIPNTSAEESNV